jgi:uncharacterized membrane protein
MVQIPITSPAPDPVLNRIGVRFNIFTEQGIPILVSRAATWLLFLAGVAMFLCVLVSGLQVMFANPSKERMQGVRSRLTNCLIGLSIVALAWALILLVQTFFGLETLFG